MTFTTIERTTCKFHSNYKGWAIYRAWNCAEDHGRMLYFGVGTTDKGLTTVKARNLGGIKDAISKVVE